MQAKHLSQPGSFLKQTTKPDDLWRDILRVGSTRRNCQSPSFVWTTNRKGRSRRNTRGQT